jgi:uncharacterized protein
MIKRFVKDQLQQALKSDLSIVLYGARQVGKTTLVEEVFKDKTSVRFIFGDDPSVRDTLKGYDIAALKREFGGYKYVVIDEAQLIENIGSVGKLIHDHLKDTKLVLTGSSSLDLAGKISEPMTGRIKELFLTPLALSEIRADKSMLSNAILDRMMIYGSYPGIWTQNDAEAGSRLKILAEQYLYKDVFNHELFFKTSVLSDIMRLLAHQIGSEVNYSEIGSSVGVSKETVKRYIYLLEQAYIVFRVQQYRRSQRREVGRLRKVYFWDLGVRNVLIDDLRPLKNRTDQGALWENLMFVERKKLLLQKQDLFVRHSYWRGANQREIDMVEQRAGDDIAYEFKYAKQSASTPIEFTRQYPDVPLTIISKTTVGSFFLG